MGIKNLFHQVAGLGRDGWRDDDSLSIPVPALA